jgi:hypothetical protein
VTRQPLRPEELLTKSGELSRKCHELLRVADADVISIFWFDTTCQTLLHELNRNQPNTTKELPDITT